MLARTLFEPYNILRWACKILPNKMHSYIIIILKIRYIIRPNPIRWLFRIFLQINNSFETEKILLTESSK